MKAAPSVCTIVRGRRTHLVNLVNGLKRQSLPPRELVIAWLQDAPFEGLPPVPFPVREVSVGGAAVPFAGGRNACAEAATGELLAFMDVDCIPGPGLLAALVDATGAGDCTMSDVRYLAGDGHAAGADFERDWRAAVEHPARRFRPASGDVLDIPDPREFWSTCFALHRADWRRCGGFDEGYEGYGGEDTDFGAALDAAGVRLRWSAAARAVHQWHRVQVPPLDHVASIVANAERFRAKHGRTCMEYWLDQFETAGFVTRGADGSVRLSREPSAEERELARQPVGVRFS